LFALLMMGSGTTRNI